MALGNELVVNGGFVTDSDWTLNDLCSINTTNQTCEINYSTGDYGFAIEQVLPAVVLGKTYRCSFELISLTSSTIRIRLGNTSASFVSTPGVHEYDLVATGDGDRIILANSTGVLVAVVDDVSVKEVLPTTTVEVEWVDSISVAATGNKIYRDDVEIADIANGVQFYSDADAPVASTPKYEVQAHDGAGDETTQEVEGKNMDYIITA